MDNHFNPVINTKLKALAVEKDWSGMLSYLHSLSNSGFRTASYILAERVLPTLRDDDYWKCFDVVATTNTKAFLMTFMKAAVVNYNNGLLNFSNLVFKEFAKSTQSQLQSIDRRKTLLAILPILKTCEEVQSVMEAFCGDEADKKVNYLVQSSESTQTYFSMFQIMREMDDAEKVKAVLVQILKRSTPLAFNFVSIMRLYFGIDALQGNFSLTLQPYELSRLEANYTDFVSILTRMN